MTPLDKGHGISFAYSGTGGVQTSTRRIKNSGDVASERFPALPEWPNCPLLGNPLRNWNCFQRRAIHGAG